MMMALSEPCGERRCRRFSVLETQKYRGKVPTTILGED
jgi:hypothetical protein